MTGCVGRKGVVSAILAALLIVSACALKNARSEGANKPISFSGLPGNRRILIDYQSRGCFHSTHCRLQFEAAPNPRLVVTDVLRSRSLGVLALSPQQVKQIDNLLTFYRQNRRDGCTTKDTIKVALLESGKTLSQESFIDESCQAGASPNRFSLWSAVLKLAKQDELRQLYQEVGRR